MNIDIYHETAERLGDDAGAKLLSMIVPRPAQPGSDLPSFVLEPPLRWATDDDSLEVVPIEVVAGPPRPWPGNDVSIFTVDRAATPD